MDVNVFQLLLWVPYLPIDNMSAFVASDKRLVEGSPQTGRHFLHSELIDGHNSGESLHMVGFPNVDNMDFRLHFHCLICSVENQTSAVRETTGTDTRFGANAVELTA